MTEEEQVEQIKKLWAKYGNAILTIILAVLLSVQGYKWYQDRNFSNLSVASTAYNGLMESVSKKEEKSILSKANYIKDNYAATVYGSSAALLLAKLAVDKNALDKAISELKWVLDNSKSSSLKQVAVLRLARIYLFQKKYDLALKTLNDVEDDMFSSLISEEKGDVFLAEGKKELASKAYQKALSQLPNPALASKELMTKINEVSEQRSQLVNQGLQSQQQPS